MHKGTLESSQRARQRHIFKNWMPFVRYSIYSTLKEEYYTLIYKLGKIHQIFKLKKFLRECASIEPHNYNSSILTELLDELVKTGTIISPYGETYTEAGKRKTKELNFERPFKKSYIRKFKTIPEKSYRRSDHNIYTVHPKSKPFFQR